MSKVNQTSALELTEAEISTPTSRIENKSIALSESDILNFFYQNPRPRNFYDLLFTWLDVDSNNLQTDSFFTILGGSYLNISYKISKKWFAKNPTTSIESLLILEIEEEKLIMVLAGWMQTHNYKYENFKSLVIDNQNIKGTLFAAWINKFQNSLEGCSEEEKEEKTFKEMLRMIKFDPKEISQTFFSYSADEIGELLYKYNDLYPIDKPIQIAKICESLYPSLDASIVDLLIILKNYGIISKLKDITEVAKQINDSKEFQILLEKLFIGEDPLEEGEEKFDTIVKLCKEHVARRYGSLAQIIEQKGALSESFIKPEYYDSVKTLINDDDSAIFDAQTDGESEEQNIGRSITNTTLLELFSYLEITNNLAYFFEIVTEELQQELRENFSNNSNYSEVFLKKTEYLKALELSGEELDFPKLSLTTSYLKEKIKILPFDPKNIPNYSINFASEERSEEQKTHLNLAFQEMLAAINNYNQADDAGIAASVQTADSKILSFFSELLDEDLEELTTINKDTLTYFVKNLPQLIILALSQENAAEKFRTYLQTLTLGCASNIGNQVSLAIMKTITANQDSAAFYSIFQKAFVAISSSEHDVLAEMNPLDNKFVNECVFVPDNLIKELKKEVDKQDAEAGKISYNILMNKDKFFKDITYLEPLPEKYKDEIVAELATYYLLKEIPDLISNRNFLRFKDFCEERIAALKEYVAKINEIPDSSPKRPRLEEVENSNSLSH